MHGEIAAHLRVFGGLRLELSSVSIADGEVPTKTASLLKLLALQPGHTLHRDKLIEALWPQADATRGTNNLYKALHRLRAAVHDRGERELVSIRRKIVSLAPWVSVDLDEFRAAAELATQSKNLEACERALSISVGGFLPCDLYEDWTASARAQTASIVQQLHFLAAETCMLQDERTRAAMHLQAILLNDPTNRRARHMLGDRDALIA
jgi:DNA-binding SARP family transcriptional activator